MFRVKRSDTLVRTVEATYGINLNARGDALLGNLLAKRARLRRTLPQLKCMALCRQPT